MKNIVIVGAGKIGSMIAELLGGSGDYAVTVVDRSAAAAGAAGDHGDRGQDRGRHHPGRRAAKESSRASSRC